MTFSEVPLILILFINFLSKIEKKWFNTFREKVKKYFFMKNQIITNFLLAFLYIAGPNQLIW